MQRVVAAILESSQDAIYTKDHDGTVTSWSAGAEAVFGWTAAEAIGESVRRLTAPGFEDDTELIMRRLRRGERIQTYETVRMAKDGRRIYVSLGITPIRDESGAIIGAVTIARDITALKLEERRRRLLADLSAALVAELEPDQVLRELARFVVRDVADYCVTYLLDPPDRIRRVGAAHADPAAEPTVQRLLALEAPRITDRSGAGRVIATGQPILIAEIAPKMLEDAAANGKHLEILRELRPISTMILPLRARGRTSGAIVFCTTSLSTRHYDEADLEFARELAGRAALAIDNARLYAETQEELHRRRSAEEALRRGFEQLRVVYEVTQAVATARRLEEIYHRALAGLQRVIGADRSALLLLDDDGVLRFKAWRGISAEYRRVAEGHSPWMADARDPVPIIIPDVNANTELSDERRAAARTENIRALAFIPLVFGGRLLGNFTLYFGTPRRLEADEIELATTIARTIAFGITRVRNEQNLREAKNLAEQASRAKSEFLGVMSHELRTPLNAIMGYVDLLDGGIAGPVNERQREHLARVKAGADHLRELIDRVLSLARMDAGREEALFQPVDAAAVARETAELVRPLAEKARLDFEVQGTDRPFTLLTDGSKLRQILLNLLGNAVKFTESGKVALAFDAANGNAVFRVRDTGTGIPPEHLERIFEPFTQIEGSRRRGGVGLGLPVSRELARLLGGELSVESTVGRGSTFTLTLPVRTN